MKLLIEIKNAFKDLIFGREIEVEPTIVQESLPNESQIITKKSFLAQTGETFIVLPFENPDRLIDFADQHPDLMFKYIMKRVSKAVRKNLPSITLFQFGNSQKNLAIIFEDKYKFQLDKMMDWFIKTEDYESASACRDIIRQLKATDAIDQSH
jgi:hypothetical protein